MQNYVGGGNPQQYTNDNSSVANIPQEAQDIDYNNAIYQMEQSIGADVQRVRMLVQQGTITQEQGQYLMTQLAGKAQEIQAYKAQLAQQQLVLQPTQTAQPAPAPQPTPMEMFNKERPGFFDGDSRADVLNYIKGFDMDKDELLRIAQLVENLENSAVDKHLKKSAYEKSLNDENTLAKSKLIAYAQNSAPDNTYNRIYTREDIGNMTGEEFTRNEKMIMDQIKQGLIK